MILVSDFERNGFRRSHLRGPVVKLLSNELHPEKKIPMYEVRLFVDEKNRQTEVKILKYSRTKRGYIYKIIFEEVVTSPVQLTTILKELSITK